MESKPVYASKTMIIQVLVFITSVIGLFSEQFQELLQEYPQLGFVIGIVLAALNAAVRMITTGPVTLLSKERT